MKAASCAHDTIDAKIEIGPACGAIRFKRDMQYPEDPPGEPLRRISIYALECAVCGKALTRRDVGERFDVGGDLHHPRFEVTYS